MTDNLPPVVGAIAFAGAALLALYHCYIRPGYERMMQERHARDAR